MIELIKQIAQLQKQVDGLIKPEVPLGLSLIQENILTGSNTSIAMSSLPQGFRHLVLITQVRTDVVGESDGMQIRFNGDATGSYDWEVFTSNSTTLTGAANRAATSIQYGQAEGASSRASNFSPSVCYVLGYSLTTTEKWTLSHNAAFGNVSADTDLFLQLRAGRWRNTAAIQQVTFFPLLGPNLVSGTRLQIYGIY